jgi:hypothetical protein
MGAPVFRNFEITLVQYVFFRLAHCKSYDAGTTARTLAKSYSCCASTHKDDLSSFMVRRVGYIIVADSLTMIESMICTGMIWIWHKGPVTNNVISQSCGHSEESNPHFFSF